MLPKWAWSGSREQFLHCGLRKLDLENFATASRRSTGDIHNSTVVGLFMTPETMGADSVASWLSAHCS